MIDISLGYADEMRGSGHNRLNRLFFIPKYAELLGDCNSDPGSIRFWSLENGHLDNVVCLDDNEFSSSLSVSPDEDLIAVGTFKLRPYETRYDTNERSVLCYSIKESRWLWKMKWVETPMDCAGCDLNVTFTDDNKRIIVAGAKLFAVYEARTGKLLQRRDKPLSDYSLLTYSKKKGEGV